MVEPLLSGIVLGLVPITIVRLVLGERLYFYYIK